jgi:hypothetical protein
MGSFARRGLGWAYWLLTFSILGDLFASLRIQNENLTATQFTILSLLAVGTLPQVALFALVITPVVMRGRFKTYSFTKALIFMEGCALVSIVILAIAFICLMHYRENVLHAP